MNPEHPSQPRDEDAEPALTITLSKCDPELRLMEALQILIDEMRLDLREIDTSNLIVQGHPLYGAAAKEGPYDTEFPRIGVDWTYDTPTAHLGDRHRNVKLTDATRDQIKAAMTARRPMLAHTDLNDPNGARYEQVSWAAFEEFLQRDGYCDLYVRPITNHIQITGWALGNAGRKTSQFLYLAVDAALPLATEYLRENYGVTLQNSSTEPELNLINADLGDRAYGWRLNLSLEQVRVTYRFRGDRRWPKKPDIAMINSKTDLFGLPSHTSGSS